ncbi:hypothetical protein R3P38DRAFT_3484941 [Favolaschia claudopus]|uniref:Uncharacterized protein n=1 Tax=Favolaschia claudopus TaxID=2862362 RepID=A0AAW0CAG3_9AGAR
MSTSPYYSLAPPAPVPPVNYCSLLPLGNARGRIPRLVHVDFVVTPEGEMYLSVSSRDATSPRTDTEPGPSVQVRIAVADGSGQGVVGSGSVSPQLPATAVNARMFTFRPTPNARSVEMIHLTYFDEPPPSFADARAAPASTLAVAPSAERRAESSRSAVARTAPTDSMDVDTSTPASGSTPSQPSTSTPTSIPSSPTSQPPPPPYSRHPPTPSASASASSSAPPPPPIVTPPPPLSPPPTDAAPLPDAAPTPRRQRQRRLHPTLTAAYHRNLRNPPGMVPRSQLVGPGVYIRGAGRRDRDASQGGGGVGAGVGAGVSHGGSVSNIVWGPGHGGAVPRTDVDVHPVPVWPFDVEEGNGALPLLVGPGVYSRGSGRGEGAGARVRSISGEQQQQQQVEAVLRDPIDIHPSPVHSDVEEGNEALPLSYSSSRRRRRRHDEEVNEGEGEGDDEEELEERLRYMKRARMISADRQWGPVRFLRGLWV